MLILAVSVWIACTLSRIALAALALRATVNDNYSWGNVSSAAKQKAKPKAPLVGSRGFCCICYTNTKDVYRKLRKCIGVGTCVCTWMWGCMHTRVVYECIYIMRVGA